MKLIRTIQDDADGRSRWALCFDQDNPSAVRIAIKFQGQGEEAEARALRAATHQFWQAQGAIA